MAQTDLRLKFDRDVFPHRLADELDEITATIQAWANKGELDRKGAATFVQPRCRYYRDTDQTISNDTSTAVQWDITGGDFSLDEAVLSAVRYDNGESFGRGLKFLRAANNTDLVPPMPGQYLAIAGVAFAANATGRRDLWLQQVWQSTTVDLGNARQFTASASATTLLQVAAFLTVRDPVATTFEDAIRVMVYQNSGGDLAVSAASGFGGTFVQMIKLS